MRENKRIASRGKTMMKSILIKDTTREEREAIVNEALGNIEGG